jgi:hypothetical protein
MQKSSPLRCEVYQASLYDLTTDGPPLFAAASYVCGNQMQARRIYCGRKSIGIPQNVYDVLRHLRFEDRPRLIWIDYLCIRQRNARETSHQVRVLHRIYAQAHVVSWLSTGGDTNLDLLEFYISWSARLWIDAVRVYERRQPPFDLTIILIRQLERYIDNQGTVLPHKHAMQALSSMLNSEYFRRVWIAQDFILGKTNACQIGVASHSIAVLASASQVLGTLFVQRPDISRPPTAPSHQVDLDDALFRSFVPALHNRWPEYDPANPKHDFRVVEVSSRRSCSDPRDYIYGVTSLFQTPDAYPVDYTLSVADIFADFTIHCMLGDRSLEVLDRQRTIGTAMESDLDLDLPTWCPNWSEGGDAIAVRYESEHWADCKWQASGTTEFTYSSPSKPTLALRGLVISKIKLCTNSTLEPVAGKDIEGQAPFDLVGGEPVRVAGPPNACRSIMARRTRS